MRRRLSYANIASTLALVVALSGTAYAVATVTSADIVNRTIQLNDINKQTMFGLLPNTHNGTKDDGGAISGNDPVVVATLDISKPGNFLVLAKLWLVNNGAATTPICRLVGGQTVDLNHTSLSANGVTANTESMSFIISEFFEKDEEAVINCDPQGGSIHVFDIKMVAIEAGGGAEEPL
jgi:hypothetical protein